MHSSDEQLRDLIIETVQFWDGKDTTEQQYLDYLTLLDPVKGVLWSMRAEATRQWHIVSSLYTVAYYAKEPFSNPHTNRWQCCILQQWLDPEYCAHAIKARVSQTLQLMTPDEFYAKGHVGHRHSGALLTLSRKKQCILRLNATIYRWCSTEGHKTRKARLCLRVKGAKMAENIAKKPRWRQLTLQFRRRR